MYLKNMYFLQPKHLCSEQPLKVQTKISIHAQIITGFSTGFVKGLSMRADLPFLPKHPWNPTKLNYVQTIDPRTYSVVYPLRPLCVCWNWYLLESESSSVMSNSLRPHVLYCPLNSLGQNTAVGSLSFSRGSSQPRNWTQVSRLGGEFFTSWATRKA